MSLSTCPPPGGGQPSHATNLAHQLEQQVERARALRDLGRHAEAADVAGLVAQTATVLADHALFVAEAWRGEQRRQLIVAANLQRPTATPPTDTPEV